MRCPKCQYITFDSDDRCRNCGYEFSLSVEDEPEPVEVRIARDEPESVRRGREAFSALDAPLNPASAPSDRPGSSQSARRPLTAADLPLFIEQRVADDQAPLVTPPAVPRAPLSVRRAAPVRPRSRGPALDELPLGPPEDAASAGADEAVEGDSVDGIHEASIARRAVAGIIDVGILGTIGAVVVLLTLRIAELTLSEWRILPIAPMLAFWLLLCGGYFILFTAAGGQTIGKMTTGIRVVNADEHASPRVSFRTAFVRTVTCLGSVVAVGGGFLPVLFSADRRAFHDRVADTRVVAA